jgi:hypothetical protein
MLLLRHDPLHQIVIEVHGILRIAQVPVVLGEAQLDLAGEIARPHLTNEPGNE